MSVTYDYKAKCLPQGQAPLFAHRVTIAYAAETYATGGLAVDWSDSGLDGELDDKTVVGVICLGGGGYVGEYDHDNAKMKVYFADYDAVADGALIEYTNSTALTATLTLLVLSL
jgi:hypothetical protein